MLVEGGNHVVVFTRKMHKVSKQPNVVYSFWSPQEKKFDMGYLKDLDAVVHLAGAGVADRRWTEKRKEEIIRSRVESTEFLVAKLKEHATKCRTLISASAIGYYGHDGLAEMPFAEEAKPHDDFLAHTCTLWEAASNKAQPDFRTVILRFGIVLGKGDGVFPQFANPQKMGVVPILGSGNQVISWIHVHDLCALISWMLQHEFSGVYNAVAPHPVSQKVISKTIATQRGGVKVPIPIPEFALKLMLGEMSNEVLKSATVSSSKIEKQGFSFKYPKIEDAVRAILQ
jgi:uncharacterized protein (TIGR01777 family)